MVVWSFYFVHFPSCQYDDITVKHHSFFMLATHSKIHLDYSFTLFRCLNKCKLQMISQNILNLICSLRSSRQKLLTFLSRWKLSDLASTQIFLDKSCILNNFSAKVYHYSCNLLPCHTRINNNHRFYTKLSQNI